MKSFIGFCNYFRDHVANFSTKMQPLNELLRDYDKRRRLIWSEESRRAFEDVKNAVHECPTLFFMDDTLPVFMHTDASKYGIGAYLFQLDNEGNEKPIAFISKTLTDTQRRWHTPQKEAYAIFYAFKQLDYLIRGVKFTLRTDHKNLIYINDTMTEMVIRWKIAVQDYDFDIEHIPGVNNIVADGLSRLIEDPSKINGETKTSFVPQILALLCPFEPENEMDYLLCNFWDEDIEVDIFCPLSDSQVKSTIPAPIRKLIGRAHNSFVGHHGRERTLAKIMSILKKDKALATQFSELMLADYVTQFIKQCPICQKLSTLHVPIQAQAFTTATYEPHQRLNIDTIGPLPPDIDGNCYILVIIDTFTRWIELYATKTVTAAEAAKMLIQHFGRFGQAQELQSDNGTQFVNAIITELCLLIGVEHKRTLAYSSEENAIVERANKEVLRHLRAIIHDTKILDTWNVFLPFVQRIMNTAVSQTTGVSPAQLLFGCAITLDRSVLVELPVHVKQDLSAWANEMVKTQYLAIDRAAAYQHIADDANIAKRQKSTPTVFNEGSLVLSKYHKTGLKKGPPHKLLTNLKGPLEVVAHTGNSYNLRNLGTQKLATHHVTDLQLFQYDPQVVDPMEIANSDTQSFIVDGIVSHTGDKRTKTKMMFMVKWKGYEGHPDEFSEVPWGNLKNNVFLHNYLRENNMTSLIPKTFL